MDLRYEIEQLLELSAKGEKYWEWEGTYEAAASSFIREHGQALVEAGQKASMWDMCNSTHVKDGVEARCHLIVGLNEWKEGQWYGYTTCTPDELAQLLDLTRSKTVDGGGA